MADGKVVNFVTLGRVVSFGSCFGFQVKADGASDINLLPKAHVTSPNGEVREYTATLGEVYGPYARPIRLGIELLDGSEDVKAFVNILEAPDDDVKPTTGRTPSTGGSLTRSASSALAQSTAGATPNAANGVDITGARAMRIRVTPAAGFINQTGKLFAYHSPLAAGGAGTWARFPEGDIEAPDISQLAPDAQAPGVVVGVRSFVYGGGRMVWVPDGNWTASAAGNITFALEALR